MGSTEFASAGRVRSIVMALFLVAAIALVVGGRANAAVLYDQVDPTSPESTTSQDFEALTRLGEPTAFRSFLFGIACNTLREHYRGVHRDHTRLIFTNINTHNLNPTTNTTLN